jgi:hypothetical protein
LVTMLALILGAALALAFVRLMRTYPQVGERRVYAVGLIVTALIYVMLGVSGGASARWLAFESLGVVFYGAAAWAGLWGRPSLLAVGWASHVAWDVALHLGGAGAGYTPAWYPWGCVSFDLVIAGAVLASRKYTAADPRGAA